MNVYPSRLIRLIRILEAQRGVYSLVYCVDPYQTTYLFGTVRPTPVALERHLRRVNNTAKIT